MLLSLTLLYNLARAAFSSLALAACTPKGGSSSIAPWEPSLAREPYTPGFARQCDLSMPVVDVARLGAGS